MKRSRANNLVNLALSKGLRFQPVRSLQSKLTNENENKFYDSELDDSLSSEVDSEDSYRPSGIDDEDSNVEDTIETLTVMPAELLKNTTINTENDKVNWLKIKWIRFQKTEPYIIQYKYDLNATEFKKMDTSKQRSRSRKQQWDTIILSSKYAEKIPISEAKKKNIEYLLETKIIPNDYKYFYDELPTTKQYQPLDFSDYEDDEP